jgi:hypothetical protein
LLLIPVAFLSDPRAALPELAYYFRDFTLTFYPLRHFQALELGAGRFPTWNPFLNEGTFHLPALYPLDLLHALWPGPVAVSWLLTLHLPLAALSAYVWARESGLGRTGAFGAGTLFALGGFTLSSLNLYVFLQALAWTPALLALLQRAARRGGRSIVGCAVVLAICVSTLAVEFVVQGLALGLALLATARAGRRGLGRVALALGLGLGLAAVPVALVVALLPETARGTGLQGEVSQGFAAHPITFLQALIPGLFGSLAAPLEHWWGGRFFSGGFPYIASLYVGPIYLAVAFVGAGSVERRLRVVLLVGALLGLWYATGNAGGLAPALSSLPGFRAFRYPSKALFLPYLALVYLAAAGLDALRAGRCWRRLGVALAAQLVVVGGVGGAALAWGGLEQALALSSDVGQDMRRRLPLDCASTAAIAAAGLALCVGAPRGRPGRGAALLVALGGADLARAGAGLNPQVSPAFFQPLPEIAALRLQQGRVFSYGAQDSPGFLSWIALRPSGAGLWAFFVNRQMLAPYNNVADRIESGEGLDRTALTASAPTVRRAEYRPSLVGSVVPKLRAAGVSHVLSLDSLAHPALAPVASVATGVPGLAIHVYSVMAPAPRAYVACRVASSSGAASVAEAVRQGAFELGREVALQTPAVVGCSRAEARPESVEASQEAYLVRTDGPGVLVMTASHARGWTARVNGTPAAVLRANGRYRAVAVPAGTSRVALSYEAPGLRLGLAVSALALAFAVALAWRSGARR